MKFVYFDFVLLYTYLYCTLIQCYLYSGFPEGKVKFELLLIVNKFRFCEIFPYSLYKFLLICCHRLVVLQLLKWVCMKNLQE